MSHVLTVKIPHSLLDQLEEQAQREGKSKGAVVREAIEKLLKSCPRKEDPDDLFRRATEAMMKGKKLRPPHKIDWEKLREKASQVDTGMTPEEEVRASRERRLFYETDLS